MKQNKLVSGNTRVGFHYVSVSFSHCQGFSRPSCCSLCGWPSWIGNELGSGLFPHTFRDNQSFVCIDQQVKGTGSFQQWQEGHGGCDLSDYREDLISNGFLRLLSGCTVISGRPVTLSVKVPALKDLPIFNIQDDQHQVLHLVFVQPVFQLLSHMA